MTVCLFVSRSGWAPELAPVPPFALQSCSRKKLHIPTYFCFPFLFQDMTPALPTCCGYFLSVWKEKLVREYKMDVSTICCEWNRCNGPNAGTSGLKGPEIHFILPLATAVIIWTRNLLAFGS